MKRTALLRLCLVAPACATTPREPVSIAEAYARALDEGRLQDAYALTNGSPEGEVAFLERYSDETTRRERAAAVRTGTAMLEARAPSGTLARTGQG
ncbi:hypothetical protein ACLESO_48670 [Pyxidicoccus sp. 3LG]